MSLVVSHYNPWREQLAVGVLGNLLNRWLDASAEDKRNTAMNEAMADALNGDDAGLDTEASQTAQDALLNGSPSDSMSNPFLGPYDPSTLGLGTNTLNSSDTNNPWLSAAQKAGYYSDSPRVSVSNGSPMSNIQSAVSGQSSSGPLGRLSPASISRIIANGHKTAPTKDLWSLLNPVIASENAYREKELERLRQQDAWDQVSSLGNSPESMIAGLRGGLPLDQLKYLDSIWNPDLKYQPIDAGDKIISNTFNSRTGELKNIGETPLSMSPAQSAQMDLNWAKLREDIRQFGLDYALKKQKLGLDSQVARARIASMRSGGGGGGSSAPIKANFQFIETDDGHVGIDRNTGRVVRFPDIKSKTKTSSSPKKSLADTLFEQDILSQASQINKDIASGVRKGEYGEYIPLTPDEIAAKQSELGGLMQRAIDYDAAGGSAQLQEDQKIINGLTRFYVDTHGEAPPEDYIYDAFVNYKSRSKN